MLNNEVWLPIPEYCSLYRVSDSTVRRYIKQNKVNHCKKNGKFYILDKMNKSSSKEPLKLVDTNVYEENRMLKNKVRMLTNELTELRMLVNLYESQN